MRDDDVGVLLSIAIPTYNGSSYIVDTLERVSCQIEYSKRRDIEIVVSDNGSTDSTVSLVETFGKTYGGSLRLVRKMNNDGFDRNVDHVIRNSKGKFVSLLGDDDYYQGEDAIVLLCEMLEKNGKAEAILLRSRFLDIRTGMFQDNQLVSWTSEIACENGDEFFDKAGWGIDPVSALIVKRSSWMCKDFSAGYGNQWIHNYALALLLSGGGFSVLVKDPVVVVRTANPRWNSNGNYYLLRLKQLRGLMDGMNSGYSKKTIEDRKYGGASMSLRDRLFSAPRKFRVAVECVRLIRSIYAPNPRWLLDSASVVIFCMLWNAYGKVKPLFKEEQQTK